MEDVAVPVALAGGEVETDVKKLSAVEQNLVARHLLQNDKKPNEKRRSYSESL